MAFAEIAGVDMRLEPGAIRCVVVLFVDGLLTSCFPEQRAALAHDRRVGVRPEGDCAGLDRHTGGAELRRYSGQ